MSRSLEFAGMLASALRNPSLTVTPRAYRVTGGMDAGAVMVAIELWVPESFRDLKRSPPLALCGEAWMKTGADWHNGPPLCWVLPDEWREAMSWKGKPVVSIMTEGRDWLLNNVRCLVSRHYVAHLEGLAEWPSEWTAWGHGTAGVREYRQEKKTENACASARQKGKMK